MLLSGPLHAVLPLQTESELSLYKVGKCQLLYTAILLRSAYCDVIMMS